MATPFNLVLFDLGGVIYELDLGAMQQAWTDVGLDPRPAVAFFADAYSHDNVDDTNSNGDGRGADHPLCRAERGELSRAELLAMAEAQAPGASHVLDGSRPTGAQRFARLSSPWVDLIEQAKTHGIMTGALSNALDGFDVASAEAYNPELHAHVVTLFGDNVLESHRLGVRKPDRAAYVAAAQHFDVAPEAILFIDDHAPNCNAATAAGLTAIHCPTGHHDRAAGQARQLLGLPDPDPT